MDCATVLSKLHCRENCIVLFMIPLSVLPVTVTANLFFLSFQVWRVKIVPLSLVSYTAVHWRKTVEDFVVEFFLCPADLESVDGSTLLGKLHARETTEN